MGEDPASVFDEARRWAEDVLERFVPAADAQPARLHRAMRYAVFGGGKRLRPALVRWSAEAFGGVCEAAERPAAAIELIHTYSLVHDDLPCMDDDALRRGRATVHVAFDEATAVLVGDALQALAFETLARAERGGELCAVLARAAGAAGMVGGQVLDLALELGGRGPRVPASTGPDVDAVLDMHARKTAALFSAAAEMGAVVAGASSAERGLAATFGRALGVAFQAVDDLLDVTGDARTLGKTPGKDAALERATLVAALGVEGARARAGELGRAAREALAALRWKEDGPAGRLIDFVLLRRT